MSDNVLLKALPPAVDYLAYLTILEYNLTSDQLPVLHDILQDTTLTTNIGWDLVHLLLPLLPASKECLQDVARLGNPREVVLKTTELLEGLGSEDDEEEEDKDESEAEEAEVDTLDGDGIGKSDTHTQATANTRVADEDFKDTHTHPEQDNMAGEASNPPATAPGHLDPSDNPDNPPAALSSSTRHIQEFTTLIDMLSVLHPRIETRYPSRFLASTLRAILRAYPRLAHAPEATSAVLKFLRVMSGMYRPVLPPRQSTGSLSRLPAPDPEAQKEEISVEETALQRRLLQSFLTHVLEDWMEGLRDGGDVPGLAWASRYSEREGVERAIPGRRLYGERFEEEAELVLRAATMDQITVSRFWPPTARISLTSQGLARHLKIDPSELLSIISTPSTDTSSRPTSPSSDLPSHPSDVPLSPTGSLYLYAASAFSTTPPIPPLPTFPTHAHLLSKSLPPSPPLLDALLFLGLSAISNSPTVSPTTTPTDDNSFHTHLRTLSLLTATTPSPTLRYHAHTLTSRLLHTHPSPSVRLAFILDTLRHCPYEKLKASAVEWIKTEILSAALDPPAPSSPSPDTEAASPFATRTCLDALSPLLFADPRALWSHTMTAADKLAIWDANMGFFLAALNLWFLLCESVRLRERLEVVDVGRRWGVGEGFLGGLREGVGGLKGEVGLGVGVGGRGEMDGEEGNEGAKAMLGLLDGVVEMVEEGMGRLGMETRLGDGSGVGG